MYNSKYKRKGVEEFCIMKTRGNVGASHNSEVHNPMKRQVVVNIQYIKCIRIKRLDVRLNGPVEKLLTKKSRSRENLKFFLSSHFIVVNNERIIIQKRTCVPLQVVSDGKNVIREFRDIGISSVPEVKEKVINVRKVVRLKFFSEDVSSINDILKPNNGVGVLKAKEDTRSEAQVHSKKEIELKYFTDGEYDMVDLDEFRHCEIIDLTSDNEEEAEVMLRGNVDENNRSKSLLRIPFV